MTGEQRGALAGLKVVDASTLYAAPFISTLLADHGADVIKVEPPEGDAYRHFPNRMWPVLGRGKRSIVLDLRRADGQDALRELATSADVIVLNLPRPALEARGLDWPTLSARNPELIMVMVTGYGLDGPYRDRPGNGTLAEAFTGLTHMTGPADGAPVIPSVPLGDAVAGWAGAFGVLAACYHRLAHSGGGQLIDLNPVDAMLQVVGPMITEYADGEPPHRMGSRLRGAVVRNVFATGDGRWVSVGLSTPRQADELAALVRDDATASGASGDLEASARRWIAVRPRGEVIAAFVERRLPIAPVNDARDLAEDPHLRERGALRTLDTPDQGPVRSPAPAPRLLGSPAPTVDRLPTVGEHSDEVLSGEDPWR